MEDTLTREILVKYKGAMNTNPSYGHSMTAWSDTISRSSRNRSMYGDWASGYYDCGKTPHSSLKDLEQVYRNGGRKPRSWKRIQRIKNIEAVMEVLNPKKKVYMDWAKEGRHYAKTYANTLTACYGGKTTTGECLADIPILQPETLKVVKA